MDQNVAAAREDVVALLFDNFGPYHLARLAGARSVLGQARVIGLQLRARSSDYGWQVAPEDSAASALQTILPAGASKFSRRLRLQAVWRYLEQLRPRAVAIAGYAKPEMLTALAWCRRRQRVAILLSESKADDANRQTWKEQLKGVIIRQFDAALVGGSLHAGYLRDLGFPGGNIFLGYNVVGNDDYAPSRIRSSPPPLPPPYFLAVNRFVEKKNLPRLLRAYAAYRDRSESAGKRVWPLALCGDGPLRAELEVLIRALHLETLVFLPGFLQQAEMLPYFAHAGVFIHASLVEQWGLVVNEAMAAGLPVIVSRTCGCFPELVDESTTPGNGRGFNPLDETELTELLSAAAGGTWDLATMGVRSLAHIAAFSPQRFGQGLLAACACGGWHFSGAPT